MLDFTWSNEKCLQWLHWLHSSSSHRTVLAPTGGFVCNHVEHSKNSYIRQKKTKPWKKGILSHALNGSFTPIKFGENWVLALARSLSSPQPAIGPDFVAVSWSYFAGTCERHWLEQWKFWNCSLQAQELSFGDTLLGMKMACGPPNLDSGPILTRFDRWNRCASMVPLVCGAAATTQHHIHIQWIQYKTIPYHTIQYNTMQPNTIQSNTIQYTILCNTVQYSSIVQYNAIQCSTIQCSAVKYPSPQCRKRMWQHTVYNQHTLLSHPRLCSPILKLRAHEICCDKVLKNTGLNYASICIIWWIYNLCWSQSLPLSIQTTLNATSSLSPVDRHLGELLYL